MHYVIGDVHGCYDDMCTLIRKIEKQDPEAQFLFVGDFIDRGPKVWETLQWVMDNITPDGKYQTVRGNHEQMVIDWFQDYLVWWDENGPDGDIESMPQTHYDFSKVLEEQDWLSKEKIAPIIQFFSSMPYSKKLEIQTIYGKTVYYRIVHAWYDSEVPEDSAAQHEINIWERNYRGKADSDEIIIHGHTPTIDLQYWAMGDDEDAQGMICYRQNAINVDGGCCFSERYRRYPCMLGAICLESLEEIYPYTLEERFARLGEAGNERLRIYKEISPETVSVAKEKMLKWIGKR